MLSAHRRAQQRNVRVPAGARPHRDPPCAVHEAGKGAGDHASKVAQEKRYEFAKKYKHHKWTRWVAMDMKWFYEVGAAGHEVEQDKQGPPLPPKLPFRAKTGETKTQGLKVMFMACVSEHKKIGLWEMKKEDWMKFKTKAGMTAKGIGAEYFITFIPKIKAAARKALGPGRIGIWIDNAKAHTAAAARAAFAKHFDDVVFQSPSSPEMNLLDAGVFPNMQAKVDEKNATTTAEIRAAVNAVWEEDITPEHLHNVANRVRRNMKQVESLKGGNWCKEK